MMAAIIIPARYASQRFPGKPLAALRGAGGDARPLIRRAWEAAMAVPGVEGVWVATDDDRIAEAARGFGAAVVMTPESCRNGTERTAAAVAALGLVDRVVVNLQGDAPLTPPWFVSALVAALAGAEGPAMATPVLRCTPEALAMLREDRRRGRVGGTTAVVGAQGRALYFSKEVLPFGDGPVFHHVGVYAYTPAALAAYGALPQGALEVREGLEQLRFLEHGLPVTCVEVEDRGRAFWEVNTPEDIARVEAVLQAEGIA
ncbi:MAG: 3-deoxy-manno-octulosonate cytidylyltransferase [Alkalilacustris sp.]